MKKILIIAGIAIILVTGGVLLFIPKKLKIGSSVAYDTNGQALFEFLMADSNWKKWWPGTIDDGSAGKPILHYSGYNFQLEELLYQSLKFKLIKDKDTYDTAHLNIIPIDVDSTGIEMVAEIEAGADPVSRIRSFYDAKGRKEAFDKILASLSKYTSVQKNMYGFNIRSEKVKMQYLLMSDKEIDHYPTTEDIYSLIEKMRAYLKTTDGKEEFSPMLNIEATGGTRYLMKVGLPVDRNLPGKDGISSKQMVKNGNIMVTDVQGGAYTIEQAIRQTEKYISDHRRSIIAIPFQSLETDRLKVTDTTKWVTKIFYPVV